MTANENNAAYELVLVDFAKGEHKQAPHLARQPFGQVPALEDGGFSMYESRAMARYIDAKSGGALTPKEAHERAEMEQWISVETSNFSPHAMKFVYQYVFHREQAADVLKAASERLDLALETLNLRLSKSPYLAGSSFSIADVCFAPYLEYIAPTPAGEKLAAHPHVARWWGEMSSRPAWKKTIGKS